MFSRLRHRYRLLYQTRHDTEHEQAFIRICIGAAGCLYIASLKYYLDTISPWALPVGVLYFATSVGIFWASVAFRQPSHLRRVFGIVLDASVITAGLFAVGAFGAVLQPFFIWIRVDAGNPHSLQGVGMKGDGGKPPSCALALQDVPA